MCQIRIDPAFNGLGLHIGDVKSSTQNTDLQNRIGNNMIRKVEVGSPAEAGGLMPGDRILEVNGENTETMEYSMLINKLRDALKIKDTIKLVVMNSVEYKIYRSNDFSMSQSGLYYRIKFRYPFRILKFFATRISKNKHR